MKNTACIALGSNIGNRYDYLVKAIQMLKKDGKIILVNCSSVYETDPVGYEDQDLFLNMVIMINTDYNAHELLQKCLKTELELGRKREIKWGPRTIDLDILTFNQENIETEELIVPHPRMLERAFVIIPLLEVNPEMLDSLQKTRLTETINKEGVRIWKQKNGEDGFEPIES
jgi:2-amino-4-hydroxy-6-hydroxymethyldihydropteridine diphosphokinase